MNVGLECQRYIRQHNAYLAETDYIVSAFLRACDRLCNLQMTHIEFDIFMRRWYTRDLHDVLSVRLTSSTTIQKLMHTHAMDQYETTTRVYSNVHGMMTEAVSLYRKEHTLGVSHPLVAAIYNRRSRCDLYVSCLQTILPDMPHTTATLQIKQDLATWGEVRALAVKLFIEKKDQELADIITDYHKWRDSIVDAVEQATLTYTTYKNTPEHEHTIEEMCAFEVIIGTLTGHTEDSLTRINKIPFYKHISQYRTEQFDKFNTLASHHLYLSRQYNEEKRNHRQVLRSRQCRLLFDPLFNDNDNMCLLTRDAIETMTQDVRHEGLMVLAASHHTHYYTLSVISQLCKAGYYAVFNAMKGRLVREFDGLFSPQYLHENTRLRPPDEDYKGCVSEQLKRLPKRKKNCFTITSVESVDAVYKETNHDEKRVCGRMSRVNKRALRMFGATTSHFDILYMIQTRYRHMYVEFAGESNNKYNELFKQDDTNACSILFRLDNDNTHLPDIYRFAFVVEPF